MFGRRQSRTERARHDARSFALRGLEQGRHRAEALRDSLPEPADVLSDLREQVEPVLKAARDQADKTPMPQRKQSRSKKPFLFIGLAIVGAVVAYLIFAKRDKEPAYLTEEPEAPEGSPAEQTLPGMSHNGSSSGDASPSAPSAPVNGEDVPERVSAYMAGQPAQPTQASSSSSAPGLRASAGPAFGPVSTSYQPRAQVAAWDLPPSSIPPMRGRSSF